MITAKCSAEKTYSLSVARLYACMANKIRRHTGCRTGRNIHMAAYQVVNEPRLAHSHRVQVQMDLDSQNFFILQYSAAVSTDSTTGQGDVNCLSSFYNELRLHSDITPWTSKQLPESVIMCHRQRYCRYHICFWLQLGLLLVIVIF